MVIAGMIYHHTGTNTSLKRINPSQMVVVLLSRYHVRVVMCHFIYVRCHVMDSGMKKAEYVTPPLQSHHHKTLSLNTVYLRHHA